MEAEGGLFPIVKEVRGTKALCPGAPEGSARLQCSGPALRGLGEMGTREPALHVTAQLTQASIISTFSRQFFVLFFKISFCIFGLAAWLGILVS